MKELFRWFVKKFECLNLEIHASFLDINVWKF